MPQSGFALYENGTFDWACGTDNVIILFNKSSPTSTIKDNEYRTLKSLIVKKTMHIYNPSSTLLFNKTGTTGGSGSGIAGQFSAPPLGDVGEFPSTFVVDAVVRKPSRPAFIPSSGALLPAVSRATRKTVPSPPITISISETRESSEVSGKTIPWPLEASARDESMNTLRPDFSMDLTIFMIKSDFVI